MERLEIINSPGGNSYNFTTLRVTKFNRTRYIVNAKYTEVAATTNNIEVAILTHTMQGNEYRKQPYKVNRKPFCNFYKNGFKNFANFPQPDDCPFPKVSLNTLFLKL